MKNKACKPILLLAAFIAVVALAIVLSAPAAKLRTLDTQARDIVSAMSTDEKIGQVLLMNFRRWGKDAEGNGIAMEECSATAKELIAKYHLGSIILFGENVKSTEKAVRLVDELQKASASGGGYPLLIGIDQEGGSVTRLGQGTCLPGNMAIGASGKTKNARIAGTIIGEELSAVGVNCNFAPVCDVNDNPDNPVINLRSFSSDANTVSKMARALRRGMTDCGVIACAKHFPGHGNTQTDTHLGLAIVNKTKSEWSAVEAVPFRAMIKSGVDVIMSAHIQYPELDNTCFVSKLSGEKIYLPATLSHTILTDILRGELGFDGVIVTDAMDMKAITDNFGVNEACIMAVNAGADLICNPVTVASDEDVYKLESLYAAFRSAIADGSLTPERLDDAARRVVLLKLKYGIIGEEKDAPPLEKRIENARAVVGSEEHRTLERKIANEGIAYYSSVPYKRMELTEGDTVLFLVQYENKGNSARFAMSRLEKEGVIPKVNTEVYVFDGETKLSAEAQSAMKNADKLIIVSQLSAASLGSAENTDIVMPQLLAQETKSLGKLDDCAVISIGLTNDAESFPDLPLFIAFGFQGMDGDDAASGIIRNKYGPNLPAAIDCLMGCFEPTGSLDVKQRLRNLANMWIKKRKGCMKTTVNRIIDIKDPEAATLSGPWFERVKVKQPGFAAISVRSQFSVSWECIF